ncbi:hypothetical protein [Burkholderia vietnamiensis]|uniref:hypothetical protein n=1 Tax=Burkholderia vietnamiensis TaxID=60552 RepID=UPI0015884697|nr:hypothetical protein [Burkholderia vietnamiensis]MBR8051343.1 hypothetical protein [Burkholderia vietnamiensis]HDR9009488.1 hypothetical protein [Burkholderia vietnamiensis]HDR9015713.1 hypothetical protein [Burkholderia vietnamiensis]
MMGPMHGPAPHPSATFQRVVISAVSARVCAQLRGDSTGQAQSARIAVACGHVRPGTIGRRAFIGGQRLAFGRIVRAALRGGGVCVP